MREEHLRVVLTFNCETQLYLSHYFGMGFNLETLAGLCQADIVLALLRGPERFHPCIESLVGRPVQRLPGVQIRPLPTTVTPEVPAADRRRVLSVAPNPRLPTTPSFQRFREFRVGRTVAQLLRRGVTRKDIREALEHSWVTLEDVV